MPATWETLQALLVRRSTTEPSRIQVEDVQDSTKSLFLQETTSPCCNIQELDMVLRDLEDRGLVGWDKHANRYDLHPIVRGIVWHALDKRAQHGIYQNLRTYFDAAPKLTVWEKIQSLDEVTPTIELYLALIGLGLLDSAVDVIRENLDDAMHYRLCVPRLRIELWGRLFLDGVDSPPSVVEPTNQSYALCALAQAYRLGGEPSRAATFFRRSADSDVLHGNVGNAEYVTLCRTTKE